MFFHDITYTNCVNFRFYTNRNMGHINWRKRPIRSSYWFLALFFEFLWRWVNKLSFRNINFYFNQCFETKVILPWAKIAKIEQFLKNNTKNLILKINKNTVWDIALLSTFCNFSKRKCLYNLDVRDGNKRDTRDKQNHTKKSLSKCYNKYRVATSQCQKSS